MGHWLESPYTRYFSGEVDFQYELSADHSSLTRWRNRLDEAGAEKLLAQTIEAGVRQPSLRMSLCRLFGFLWIQPDRTDGLPVARVS